MEKKNLGINIVHIMKGHFGQQGLILKKYFPQRFQQDIHLVFTLQRIFHPFVCIISTNLLNSKYHFGEWVN
jgi:hypothetical protein